MAYDTPTLEAFRARYSEFDAVSDETVGAVMADADREVTTRWLERDYAPAIMLLTAHLLLAEGHIERASGGKSTMTTQGPITQRKVGEVSVSYGNAGGSGSTGSGDAGGYGSTEYGRRFVALMRKNFAGPLVA